MSPRPPPPIPLLRHDLALLAHHDPSTRRLSLHSLKHFISLHLDSLSLPSFVDQLSSLAPRASAPSGNLYAVSLFADVARVHHQAIVPFIPRIMASVVRCISSSSSSSSSSGHGSSLHQACADVVLSLARYAMDPSPAVDSPASPPAEVLRLLCRPLLAPLCSNLEHVAAGAAACLSALVAVDEWNFAGEELAADIHRRCCACLLEKGRVWTGHLRLAKSLAARIPVDAVEMMEHRDSLLRLAAAVLLPETSGAPLPRRRASPWQLRVAAAQLIGTLLPTVFFATAASSDSTPLVSAAASAAASALDACKHDKTPMVRQAVAEAISTMSSDESFVSVSSPDLRRRSVDRLTFRKTKKSLWNGDDSLESTAGIGGANTGFLVHSVESSSESAAAEEVAAASIRSPLYPAKQSPIVDAVPSSVDRHLQRLLLSSSDLKENTPYVPREHSLSLKSEELGYILFNTGAKLSKEIAGDLSTRTSTAAHVGGADDSAPEVEKYADRDAAEDSSLEEKCQADIHGAAVSVESLSERDDDEDPVLELCNSVPAATGDGGGDGLFDGSCRRSASDTDMTGGEMRHIQTELYEKAKLVYGLKEEVKLQYLDDEGDYVTISCDSELEEAIRVSSENPKDKAKVLRVQLVCAQPKKEHCPRSVDNVQIQKLRTQINDQRTSLRQEIREKVQAERLALRGRLVEKHREFNERVKKVRQDTQNQNQECKKQMKEQTRKLKQEIKNEKCAFKQQLKSLKYELRRQLQEQQRQINIMKQTDTPKDPLETETSFETPTQTSESVPKQNETEQQMDMSGDSTFATRDLSKNCCKQSPSLPDQAVLPAPQVDPLKPTDLQTDPYFLHKLQKKQMKWQAKQEKKALKLARKQKNLVKPETSMD